MDSFAANVFDMFAQLQTSHRFVPARAMSRRGFASLVRRETEDIFTYVFVHDGRQSNADLDVSVWVAPPHEPGDGLDNLYVGYKVRIAKEYEINDDFFRSCQDRIMNFLPCVVAMAPTITAELQAPFFRTRRWVSYMLERQVTSLILREASRGNQHAASALDVARRVAKGKGVLENIEEASISAAANIIEDGLISKQIFRHYEGSPQRIGAGLAGNLYAHALGEISGALC